MKRRDYITFVSVATQDATAREIDGPSVAPPKHRGFGARLLSRAMDQFGGTVETAFEPTGLVCKLKVNLAERTPSIVPEMADKRPGVLAAD